ncbi:MAG: thioredoxin domain-containing protein [Tissierellia bacterium]|nr:thioredoxin domain-containing protein [Tissierellia bacterium]
MNRLAYEKSPYLLQHKDNPINWYPWGEEALQKSKEEDKPIFLSIGYSTCRWCHNMNRESFQDEEVAEILNKYFIPIKVDREERPDLDKVYIYFAEALTGYAGWPLTVFLTPDKIPFYAGTYFPKRSQNNRIGLIELLNKIKDLWKERKEEIIKDSNNILEEVDKSFNRIRKGNIDEDIFYRTYKELENSFDETYGGFTKEPKFPLPQYILYLLIYGWNLNNEKALKMAEFTLESMYKGGLFDHVGFGFYRYSTDKKWLVPHFEKMLYDNALLGIAYTKVYEVTGKPLYKEVAEKIYKFVLGELLSDEGGFYSALDAETEGEEGKYYVFTYDEIIGLLGEELGEFYCKHYDITREGNFEGKNIPNLISKNLEDISKQDWAVLDSLRDMILTYREERVKPHRDEKILTSWNGLMIASLAYGGKILNKELFIRKAKEAADFIIENSIDQEGKLLAIHIDGVSYNYGFLEDYAYFSLGLLTLYDVTGDEKYLSLAKKLVYDMLDLFWDDEDKAMFYYSQISESLILRPKDIYDGATPSGNSIAAMVLNKLYRILRDESLYEKHRELLMAYGKDLNENPTAHLYSLLALMNFSL